MRALLAVTVLLAVTAPVAQARLDRGFAGGKGWRAFTVGAYDSTADAIIRTRGGKLLVGGTADAPRTYDTVLGFARFHPSGRLDRRFGRRGRALVDGGEPSRVVAMNERPDGRILVAFSTYGADPGEFRVVRLRPGGRIDRSYGVRGVARVAVPGEGAELADMAVLPGGRVVLAGSTRLSPLDLRVVLARLDARGRSQGEPETHDLGRAHAVGLVRTRIGHLVLAAAHRRGAGQPAGTILTGLGPNPWRREISGARAVDLAPDRRAGVAVLLDGGGRWGVRRYAEDLRPRKAPPRLPSGGDATSLAIDRGGFAWVGMTGGRVARVRPDGRPDGRFAARGRTRRLRTRYMLDTTALAVMPRHRVAAAGRAFPEDTGDIREDYGPSRMWIARYAR